MKHSFHIIILFCFMLIPEIIFAGTTGKIMGTVNDDDTGEPLIGANILIQGTQLGAATNMDGEFFILNIPPGVYSLRASMIGYQDMVITNLRVSVDLTTEAKFKLKMTALVGEEVIIVAVRPLVQKDLSSSASFISSETLDEMPVETLFDVLELQAGIVKDTQGNLHLRGGRSGEVAYLIDNISMTDPYSGNLAVTIENDAIQELQVVSGTFNAEYGQAMSGVVNIVTKDPADKFFGRFSAYLGDYLSNKKDIFLNIDEINPLGMNNIQGTLSGPMPLLGNKFSAMMSLRYNWNEGWLYGQRRFNTSDSSNFDSPDPAEWIIEETGDNKMVAMNSEKNIYFTGKLLFRFTPSLIFKYSYLRNYARYQNYAHLFKYNPDGNYQNINNSYSHLFNMTHVVSANTFYSATISYFFTEPDQYVYEDPMDSRYVDPKRLRSRRARSFYTGGTEMWHYHRNTTSYSGKFEFSSQVTSHHLLKSGFEIKQHRLYSHEYEIQIENGYQYIPPLTSYNHNEYTHKPLEFSTYLQDKIEYSSVILNLGVRFDFFDPAGKVPIDLRDPIGVIRETENDILKKSTEKYQFSPRIAISYPITDQGILFCSYGHFFQMPRFEYLYHNSEFEIVSMGLSSKMGNANLEPERTIAYEVGLQQQITGNMGFYISGYYKDIRNLLDTEINELYSITDRYARYINRDYGNIRGITIALERRHTNSIAASIDYTYQVAEGNASDPNTVFNQNQSQPPLAAEKQVVPLNWDQRHTLNASITIGDRVNWGVSFIGKYGSGLPYTPETTGQTIFENGDRKPATYSIDLHLYKNYHIGSIKYAIFLKIYNLFDRLNEFDVYKDSGRAGYTRTYGSLDEETTINTISDFANQPQYYGEPRRLILGVSIDL